jgi:hypothetical protein
MTMAEVAVWTPYQARPGRRVLVATNLAGLRGPVHGTVVLPLRLYWSPAGRVFDLDDPYMLRTVYEFVLQESVHADELATWLNGDKLAEVWPQLWLPKCVRRAWEDYHPQLRSVAAA